ncbi:MULTISPECIES: NAD(P)/FAD-dependent oxidoreductase [unclassified Microbacterium]|uniref:dihydrolipoyl dehydrogenase family protein n=1 Tax=unclassified Microbacterium TaxID=2609290 RepID=UPI0012F92211|nr:NAD(P)/FAD-dependent oxidoreductase [Microbacterium sp. MAH-37]MVQ42677.1 pyridine nucleotide-disulfide oxidoreductase [Microbacterium sp. MAH-37]
MQTEYDLIVLGGGAVGENVADRAVQGGLSVVIVEDELVGGECSYWACMPSKALLRPAAALRAARRVPGASEAITGDLDVSAVFARRDEVTNHWHDDSQVRWVEGAGIDLIRGHGRFIGPKQIEVAAAGVVLTARHAVAVVTGSRATIPDIPGLRDSNPWTSREATSAKRAPASLAVIGGGVVGAEMAAAYASFGTEVTMIARGRILGSIEPFAAGLVVAGLEEQGVRILTDTSPASVDRDPDGVRISLEGETLLAEEVLVATGRSPRTDDLGLEAIGLKPGGWLETDDTMRVPGFDWLYAVGDVTHRALFTHQGKYQARAAGDVIAARAHGAPVDDAPWGAHVATADHRAVPQVVFTDPEVAAVGLTAAEADAAGLRTRVIDYDLSWLAGASVHAVDYHGQGRMIVDEDRRVIVGATFAGPDVADLVQAATIAIVGEVPIDRLWHAVPAYPTVSEVWLRFLEEYGRPVAGAHHIPAAGEPSIPELEVDENIAPRPEEEAADLNRAEPDVADHSHDRG